MKQTERKAKTRYTESVYLTVNLPGDSRRYRMVHQLVLEAFRGPRGDRVSRHWNGDSLDNRLENLVYGTQKENWADAVRHGTIIRGSKRANSKIKEEDAAYIKGQLAVEAKVTWLAKKFGLSAASITNIRRGRIWPHVETPVMELEGPRKYSHHPHC